MGAMGGGGGILPRPVTVKQSVYDFRVKPGLFLSSRAA